jgi:UDPglucose 6-dehydrogenase
MRISVIGTGYVGLVVGACLAEFGNQVCCVERDESKLSILRQGRPAHYEPGLDRIMQRNMKAGRLTFAREVAEGAAEAKVAFIAVGTPQDSDGSADLSQVLSAARELAGVLPEGAVVVTKSTVPVGTGDRVQAAMEDVAGRPVVVVSNPEFLKEGHAVEDFMAPDRVVVGTDDAEARRLLAQVYAPVTTAQRPVLFMDRRSAELTKYAANALLATKISFMNELSRLCDRVDADINDVRQGVGTDHRIGPRFLYAGPGFGGSCFPKDVSALVSTGAAHDVDLTIPRAVLEVNRSQQRLVGERIISEFGGQEGALGGRVVAVLGLAFKPETDDLRESPALVLVDQLLEAGATVRAHDPRAMAAAEELYGGRVELCPDAYAAAEGADVVALMTEWRPFRQLDLAQLAERMRGDTIYDGRNVWDPETVRAQGFQYRGIGRR